MKSYLIHQTEDIFIIAQGGSTNRKTGNMVQIWILDNRMHPVESRRGGFDASNQCQGCPLASGNGCYVNTNPLSAIYRKHKGDNPYPLLEMGTPEWASFFEGQAVRFGAYGNPSLIPLSMVESIAGFARKWTGYFHDWDVMEAELAKAYGKYFMASCESTNWAEAHRMGLRTFTTVPADTHGTKDIGMECLADAKGMTCVECGLCDGTNRRQGKLPHVWIKVHGYQTKKASAATSPYGATNGRKLSLNPDRVLASGLR